MNRFPEIISFTLTNRCNLRCRMCGQWGVEGYLVDGDRRPEDMDVSAWKRLVDQVAAHGREWIHIRGGEPFLYPGILEVLAHIRGKGLHASMDTNGTLLNKFAADIARLGPDHFNVSIDGPEPVHDEVRGVKGTFARLAEGLAAVDDACAKAGRPPPSRIIVFTISDASCKGLAAMPDVARALKIPGIAIVPYYWFDRRTGEEYERVMKQDLGCSPWSWQGFHRETSGVDRKEFEDQFRRFREVLHEIRSLPYMRYGEAEYREWFSNCTTKVGRYDCRMPWRLIDIQPNGDANFCVDFPDYLIGNAARETIEQMWNGPRAERFRERLARGPLPICHRCGAKYMAGSEPD